MIHSCPESLERRGKLTDAVRYAWYEIYDCFGVFHLETEGGRLLGSPGGIGYARLDIVMEWHQQYLSGHARALGKHGVGIELRTPLFIVSSQHIFLNDNLIPLFFFYINDAVYYAFTIHVHISSLMWHFCQKRCTHNPQ